MNRLRQLIYLVLFFGSGAAGLIYEVLWMKELGLLFGNTAYAAATTLAAFFLGLAAGGFACGRLAARSARPLRLYALLEAGVALSALLYFLLLDLYYASYPWLFDRLADHYPLFIGAKLVLALLILFPPAFFLGGTLPAMSQFLVRGNERLGKTVAVLYAVNTSGAAAGALAAGFYLPDALGIRASYLLAITVTVCVALLAWAMGGTARVPAPETASPARRVNAGTSLSRRSLHGLAFLSGFVALALEVLWTRMFVQVLQNSVYTFSAVLVTFLVAIAGGGLLVRLLLRFRWQPPVILITLLTASAFFISLSPSLFLHLTDGLSYFGAQDGWGMYVLRVFGYAGAVMLLPGILASAIFPLLIKLSETHTSSAGRTVGSLTGINTLGGVAGSLAGGFVLLDLLGLWSSVALLAAVFFLVALLLAERLPRARLIYRAAPAAGVILLFSFLHPGRLPLIKIDPVGAQESLLEVWEGSAATVAVVRSPNDLELKVNNHYTVGDTAARAWEETQAHLPLLLSEKTDSVFFLGMGTGITAAAALAHPVERVVVAELVPAVVDAARKYFRPYLRGLFEDPRVDIVAEDGRNYLLGSGERFDVIVSDLFVPWKAGTGALFTREHFEGVRRSLNDDGLFALWLPTYEHTRQSFATVARTFLEVFPRATLWRGNFSPRRPVMALVGFKGDAPLDLQRVEQRLARLEGDAGRELLRVQGDADAREAAVGVDAAGGAPVLLYYAGNLGAVKGVFADESINTDDRPLIEYQVPVMQHEVAAGRASWLSQAALFEFLAELRRRQPWEEDPVLAQATSREVRFAEAGLKVYEARVRWGEGSRGAAVAAMRDARDMLGQPRQATERIETLRRLERLERTLKRLRQQVRR